MARHFVGKCVRLCNYLQDPCHVATFQKMCGIKGTFPDKLNNAGGHLSPRGEIGAATDVGDQEYPRKRHSPNVTVNGEVESRSCGDATGTQADQDSCTGSHNDAANARAKPLRRNSLTGEAGQEFIVHNKFLFYLFTFGTELGNEMFFIIFFPFLFWNVDALVSRRLIVVWAWNLFVGQSTKDVVRWSRPASPPVVKVEVFYNTEYSMPSTHAMTGTALPFCLFFLTYGRWQYSFLFGLCMALSWSVLVCVSRVYMGMHSILEVITGFLYGLLVLAFFQQVLDKIDNFYMMNSYAPVTIVFFHVSLGLVAFSLDSWSTSRGDTAQALGTAVGAALGSHVNHQLGLMADPPLSALPLTLPPLSSALLLRSLLRFLIGVAVILITRMGMKAVTIPFLCRVHGLPTDDLRKARQLMRVELPYRYIVYGVVGFSCVCVVPIFFSVLNIA